jgi:hypothetical protein
MNIASRLNELSYGRDDRVKAKPTVAIFVGVCLVLVVLLLFQVVSPMVGGALFAVALVVLGGLSRGFKKN